MLLASRITATIAIRKMNLRRRGRGGCVCSGQSMVSGNFSTPRGLLHHAELRRKSWSDCKVTGPCGSCGSRLKYSASSTLVFPARLCIRKLPSDPIAEWNGKARNAARRRDVSCPQISSVRPLRPSSFTILPTSCEWSRCAIRSASSVSTITRFSTPTSATNFRGLKM